MIFDEEVLAIEVNIVVLNELVVELLDGAPDERKYQVAIRAIARMAMRTTVSSFLRPIMVGRSGRSPGTTVPR